jgi:hypothetical protein
MCKSGSATVGLNGAGVGRSTSVGYSGDQQISYHMSGLVLASNGLKHASGALLEVRNHDTPRNPSLVVRLAHWAGCCDWGSS